MVSFCLLIHGHVDVFTGCCDRLSWRGVGDCRTDQAASPPSSQENSHSSEHLPEKPNAVRLNTVPQCPQAKSEQAKQRDRPENIARETISLLSQTGIQILGAKEASRASEVLYRPISILFDSYEASKGIQGGTSTEPSMATSAWAAPNLHGELPAAGQRTVLTPTCRLDAQPPPSWRKDAQLLTALPISSHYTAGGQPMHMESLLAAHTRLAASREAVPAGGSNARHQADQTPHIMLSSSCQCPTPAPGCRQTDRQRFTVWLTDS